MATEMAQREERPGSCLGWRSAALAAAAHFPDTRPHGPKRASLGRLENLPVDAQECKMARHPA